MTVLGGQERDKERGQCPEEGREERDQVSLGSRWDDVGEGVQATPSLPQEHFPASSLAPPSTSVLLGEEAGWQGLLDC